MTQPERSAPTSAALDYDTTIIGALELSEKKWVLAVQLPGVKRHTRHVLGASGEELASLIERLKARCAAAGQPIARVILTHEAGRDGFWLASFLVRRGFEVHVMQPSSLPVDRRARRAKTDVIDVECVRALMAWLRGEPRVCSMVPIPDEADEEARRAHREREDLVRERRSILNKIDAILSTLGVKDYRGLRSDRREQLAGLRQPDGDPVPRTTFNNELWTSMLPCLSLGDQWRRCLPFAKISTRVDPVTSSLNSRSHASSISPINQGGLHQRDTERPSPTRPLRSSAIFTQPGPIWDL